MLNIGLMRNRNKWPLSENTWKWNVLENGSRRVPFSILCLQFLKYESCFGKLILKNSKSNKSSCQCWVQIYFCYTFLRWGPFEVLNIALLPAGNSAFYYVFIWGSSRQQQQSLFIWKEEWRRIVDAGTPGYIENWVGQESNQWWRSIKVSDLI